MIQTPAASGAIDHQYNSLTTNEKRDSKKAKMTFWISFCISFLLFFTLNPLSCFPYLLGFPFQFSPSKKVSKWGRASWYMFWTVFFINTCLWCLAIILVPFFVSVFVGSTHYSYENLYGHHHHG